MKKVTSVLLGILFIFTISSCDQAHKKDDPGLKVVGKKGGELEAGKGKLEIEGKKGGEMKIDSNGAKIEKPNK